MALVQIPPVPAHVRWDRRTHQPIAIRWEGHQRRVVRLDAVRDELSAYPADRGPRITFVLRTEDGGRASLVFDTVRRAWYVEALEQAA